MANNDVAGDNSNHRLEDARNIFADATVGVLSKGDGALSNAAKLAGKANVAVNLASWANEKEPLKSVDNRLVAMGSGALTGAAIGNVPGFFLGLGVGYLADEAYTGSAADHAANAKITQAGKVSGAATKKALDGFVESATGLNLYSIPR